MEKALKLRSTFFIFKSGIEMVRGESANVNMMFFANKGGNKQNRRREGDAEKRLP